LNIRNLLDENTVFPLVTVDARDGKHTPSVAVYNLKEPRTYLLPARSNSNEAQLQTAQRAEANACLGFLDRLAVSASLVGSAARTSRIFRAQRDFGAHLSF